MIINVKTSNSSYEIVIEQNVLSHVEDYLNLKRKVIILTDDGIPKEYIDKVSLKCETCFIYTIKQGENSKNFTNYEKILKYMIENNFTRDDCLIALGGGVVGDLGGFVASTFMRGITFYNLPTTLLSQVDSSIGGKAAIDMDGYKNLVGSFYPPKKVLIDSTTLKTLDQRQLYSGLVESIKMSMTHSQKLFDLILNSDNLFNDIDEIIVESLLIKKQVVEEDEKELGLRKVLNFGHTIGHVIESETNYQYLHGECVAKGMTYFVSKEIKPKLLKLLNKYNLPPEGCNLSLNNIYDYLVHDKKTHGKSIDIVLVNEIGSYEIRNMSIDELIKYLEVE